MDNVTSWTGLKLEEQSGKWTTERNGERRFIVWPTIGMKARQSIAQTDNDMLIVKSSTA